MNAFQRRASNNSDRPNYWIIKPANCSRGIGIRIIDRLDKIPISLRGNTEEHLIDKEEHRNQCNWSRSNFVVCEYISNPLLIYGKKFDLRIYVLATSFLPLKAFVYRKGFTRFCTEVYSNSSEQLDNQKIHLTNISLQKHSGSNGTNYRNSTLVNNFSLLVIRYRHEFKSVHQWKGFEVVTRETKEIPSEANWRRERRKFTLGKDQNDSSKQFALCAECHYFRFAVI